MHSTAKGSSSWTPRAATRTFAWSRPSRYSPGAVSNFASSPCPPGTNLKSRAAATTWSTSALARPPTQAGIPSHRFKGRLEIAKLCLTAGQNEIALAQLEGLEKVAEQHRLIDWEPQLATDLYVHLYRIRRMVYSTEDPEQKAKLAASFERLCQLDAGEAFKILQS